jgi:hypothetical protein
MTLPTVFTPEQVTKTDMEIMRKEFKTGNVGFVYFLTAGDEAAVKIGFAKDLDTRVQCLQTGNHLKLEEYFYIKTCKHVEKIFQRIFADERIRLEWFNHTDELDELIECLQDVELSNMTLENVDEHFFFKPQDIASVVGEWATSYGRRQQ